jgi:FkbH-like protein
MQFCRGHMQLDLDYFQLLAEARNIVSADDAKKLRLAVMADCATQHLLPPLRALFRRKGIQAEIYEGSFAAIELEVRNPTSPLYEFQPDIVLVLQSVQALRDRFYRRNDWQSFYGEQCRQLASVWDSITSTSHALVIQSTFVPPMERVFGNYDRKIDTSLSSTISTLNSYIINEAKKRGNVLILDLEAVASWVGRQFWFDERLWVLGKALCSLEHLPLVAQNIVDIAVAAQGQTVKCIVLDLDNTLWGGIVGEDGPHGIRVGAHGDGEPFFRLQCFLRELKKRGILLAVCSKNERANALRPFQENSEMVLTLDDFVMFVANWNDKPQNIRTIRQELNIGLDSMLFLDDSPFERASVRAMLPDVIVPELPEDPTEWVKSMSEWNLFEVASFSAEDTQRSGLYLQEARRRTASENASSFEAFLQTLDMTIEVGRFVPKHLGRIAQLLQRSNQFNLTTRRHNEAECEAMMRDINGWIPLYGILRDRFGDHGLISIVILRPEPEPGVLTITDWLMSCRVLGRGVEQCLMNYVVTQGRELGLNTIRAAYVPTPKNEMVRDFYARFGFEKIDETPHGATDWTLDISSYEDRHVLIRHATDGIGATAI